MFELSFFNYYFQGKLPLSGIIVNRLDDNDNIKNAFEITGPLIERRIAVCQGPNEANKWVDLLTTQSNGGIDIRRQTAGDLKRNVSSSAVNIPQPPPHVSFFFFFSFRYYCFPQIRISITPRILIIYYTINSKIQRQLTNVATVQDYQCLHTVKKMKKNYIE